MSKRISQSSCLTERIYTAFIEDRFHESELHGDSKPTVTQMLTYMDRFTIEAIAKARKYGVITPGTVGQWLRFDKKPYQYPHTRLQHRTQVVLDCGGSQGTSRRRVGHPLIVASVDLPSGCALRHQLSDPQHQTWPFEQNRFFFPDELADILNAPLPGAAAPVATTIAFAKGWWWPTTTPESALFMPVPGPEVMSDGAVW